SSACLARLHVGIPPRADIGGARIIAVHDVDRLAAACLSGADAQLARLVAPFRAQPHTVVAPQARSFDSFVRRPVAGVDGAAAPAIFDQELRRRIGIERRYVIVDVTPGCGTD